MSVLVSEYADKSVLVLTPTDDLLTARVVEEIQRRCNENPSHHVVIDCTAVRFFVSGSLAPHAEPIVPLLELHRQLQEEGRRLLLCSLSSEIADVLQITRLDQIFSIQPDVENILSGMPGKVAD